MFKRFAGVALLCTAVVLSACGKAAADPAKVLEDSARAMSLVRTLRADVTFGAGATVQGFELISASGKVRRPADSDTTGKVKSGGALIQPELVSIGGKTYLREAQFLPFHELSAADAAGYPSAGRLLDAGIGITALLPKGRSPVLEGNESIDGHDVFRVASTYTAELVNPALAPIVVSGDVKALVWVDSGSKLVRRVRLSGHLFDVSKVSTIEVRLHDFDAPVEISAPG
ncbi:MAG: LppX_LprAFG lipoprotein [Candidatus Dormibacteria bacterium]